MTTLTKIGVTLSPAQKKKMRLSMEAGSGVTIRLKNSMMKGPFPMMLTRRQMTKMKKALSTGKGMQLTISQSQMRAMRKEGGILPLLGLALAGLGGLISGAASVAGKKLAEKFLGKGLAPAGQGVVQELQAITAPKTGGRRRAARGLAVAGQRTGRGTVVTDLLRDGGQVPVIRKKIIPRRARKPVRRKTRFVGEPIAGFSARDPGVGDAVPTPGIPLSFTNPSTTTPSKGFTATLFNPGTMATRSERRPGGEAARPLKRETLFRTTGSGGRFLDNGTVGRGLFVAGTRRGTGFRF